MAAEVPCLASRRKAHLYLGNKDLDAWLVQLDWAVNLLERLSVPAFITQDR